VHPTEGSGLLRDALGGWGFNCVDGPGDGTVIIVADRPDPRWIPGDGTEVLWWVAEGGPEEVSDVLSHRPGWVVRRGVSLETVKAALVHLQQRDLGSEGWLRQMLHLATLDELLRPILKRAVRVTNARCGAIWIRVEDRFFQRCGEGYPEAPLGMSEAAVLVQQGEAFLLCPGEQVGILRLREPVGSVEDQLDWIKEVEDLIFNTWSLERSQALSFKDDLTVAQNRRCLEVELPQAVRDAASRGESVALLFVDVDNLKALNSQFGHPTGSTVLKQVALEAQRIIRAQDRLYRYGGDEFCLVIPGAQAQGAVRLGERLIQALQKASLRLGETDVPISISVGIAAFPAHADGAEHLVEKADRALFKAKSSGKGCVILADGD
jgi:diguanylate cyclase (GGDEF)-like protein